MKNSDQFLNMRSACKHKAWGLSPRLTSLHCHPELSGESRPQSKLSPREILRQKLLTAGATGLVVLFMHTGSIVMGQVSKDDSVTSPSRSTPNTNGSLAYTLQKRDNEFGFWGGVSFAATTIFGGLHEDEAANRKFVIAAFRYGRTLAANHSVALQYTLDAIPVAVETGDIVSSTTIGTVTVFRRETAYGAGLTPLGLQLDFANGSRVHPFVHVNGGALIFNKPVPLPDSGKFAFVGEAGGGVRVFTSQRRAVTLGLRFHHISNANLSRTNRGLNQFVVDAEFSVFK